MPLFLWPPFFICVIFLTFKVICQHYRPVGVTGIEMTQFFPFPLFATDHSRSGRKTGAKINFVWTSKEIHISFSIREALDGNLIAGSKNCQSNHPSVPAGLKYSDTYLQFNSWWVSFHEPGNRILSYFLSLCSVVWAFARSDNQAGSETKAVPNLQEENDRS